MDLILRGATLPDGRTGIDIGIAGGRIAAVEPEGGRAIYALAALSLPPRTFS
jgi:cytosine deaminase